MKTDGLKELLLCTVVESGETLYLLTSTKTSNREEDTGKGDVKGEKDKQNQARRTQLLRHKSGKVCWTATKCSIVSDITDLASRLC